MAPNSIVEVVAQPDPQDCIHDHRHVRHNPYGVMMTKQKITEVRDDALNPGSPRAAVARAVEKLDAILDAFPAEPYAPYCTCPELPLSCPFHGERATAKPIPEPERSAEASQNLESFFETKAEPWCCLCGTRHNIGNPCHAARR